MTNAHFSDYFSDRELGPRPRIEYEITPVVWAGIVALVEALASKGAFGASFPEKCPDGQAICGNDVAGLNSALEAEIHGLSWPLDTKRAPDDDFMSTKSPWAPPTLNVLDFIEFTWQKIAQPIPGRYHDYWHHHHLAFNVEAGRDAFCAEVNRIFARNSLAYELGQDGQVRRVLPEVLGDALMRTYFNTGDKILDVMLEESRTKFSDPNPLVRREALERLFDCWERIKTLADANNKLKSITAILDKASPEPVFREVLETEAKKLTELGNTHLLRHHEISQTPVVDSQHVDYLYHRLFAMIVLLISKNAPSRT